MRIGLSVYGTTFGMGLHPASGRPRVRPREVMDKALEAGLDGVELPPELFDGEDVRAHAAYARERGLFITVASSGFDPKKLERDLELAAELGAESVRTVVGGADFGGDRRGLAGRWQEFMDRVLDGLSQAIKAAEQSGVNLAVENHQDLASEDLLWLCKAIGSERFGVTLDTANPLATAEHPLEFALKVGPYVKNVHLKDYWIYLTEEGYRLVRCPLGQGVIDFPAVLHVLSEWCPNVTMSVEIGALEARHTRVFAEDYWRDYAPRTAADLARVIRFVRDHARPGDWRTPYELGEPAEAIIAYEDKQLAPSLAYARWLREYAKSIGAEGAS